MTDQMTPHVTDEDRRLARKWAESMSPDINGSGTALSIARVILDAVPTPPLPTLANMTPVARRECQWMQCEVRGDRRIIALILDDRDHNHAVTLDPYGHTAHCSFDSVTPRPDLPRMEWPGNEKPAPAPALPEGWRLADHPQYGPVVVTSMEPDDAGFVWFVRTDPYGGSEGYDAGCCKPDVLTFLAQEAGQ